MKFADLMPGDYWVTADFLGISAGSQCFHVSTVVSVAAKNSIRYTWGDYPNVTTRRVSGTILDSQPSADGTPIWRLTHRVTVPIMGAQVTLLNP